ncbi:MAG: hypothetical protein Q8P18_33230 [Pseudomonadota bacterium]|nr:hypothetical protein [Pseudomonadota bacterium]
MQFQPSPASYGAADYSALIGAGISAGTQLASQAIAQGGRKAPKRNAKRRQQAQLAQIEAAQPSYNPMWVVGGGLVVAAGVLGYMLLRRPAVAVA